MRVWLGINLIKIEPIYFSLGQNGKVFKQKQVTDKFYKPPIARIQFILIKGVEILFCLFKIIVFNAIRLISYNFYKAQALISNEYLIKLCFNKLSMNIYNYLIKLKTMKIIIKLIIICLLLSSIVTQTCLSAQTLLPVADDALGTNLNPQCFNNRHYLPNCKYYKKIDVAATTTPAVAAYYYFGCWLCQAGTGGPPQYPLNQVPRSTSGTTSSVSKTCYSTNEKVDSCTAYRVSRPISSSSINECVACLGTHTLANFINGNITCTIRVTNCVTYVQSQAQAGTIRCSACSPSGVNPRTPIYNTDGITTRCVLTSSIAVITNCADYQETTTGGTIFRCKTCNTNYLLATFASTVYTPAGTSLGTACINPIVTNCLTYYQNGASYYCRTCAASYSLIYTSSGSVAPTQPNEITECLSSVTGCLTFDPATNYCTSCDSMTLIYSSNGSPVTGTPTSATECVNPVTSCQVFNTTSKFCSACSSKTLIYSSDGSIATGAPATTTECVNSVTSCQVFNTTSKFCSACTSKTLIYTVNGSIVTGAPAAATQCVNPVTSCEVFNTTSKFCSACTSKTLIYTSNGTVLAGSPVAITECITEIENCQQYRLLTKQCSKCATNFPNYVRINQAPYHSCIATRIPLCAVYTTSSGLACHCQMTISVGKMVCSGSSLKCRVTTQYTDQCP